MLTAPLTAGYPKLPNWYYWYTVADTLERKSEIIENLYRGYDNAKTPGMKRYYETMLYKLGEGDPHYPLDRNNQREYA